MEKQQKKESRSKTDRIQFKSTYSCIKKKLPNGANVVREQNDINKVAYRLIIGKRVHSRQPTTDTSVCLIWLWILNFGVRENRILSEFYILCNCVYCV